MGVTATAAATAAGVAKPPCCVQNLLMPAALADPPSLSHSTLQTALHWGYIPAIITAGMLLTEPRPSLGQLLGPM